MKTLVNLIAVLGTTSGLLLGCAADTDEQADGSAVSEDALTPAELGPLSAASITDYAPARFGSSAPAKVTSHPTIASTTKVNALLRALTSTRPDAPRPACDIGSPHRRITFFDDHGKTQFVVSLACGVGSGAITHGRTLQLRANSAAIQAVLDAPRVPADVLFDVDEVTIEKRGAGAGKTVLRTKTPIARIVRAIDGDVLKVPYRMPRCLPNRVLTFAKAGHTVATVTYDCGSSMPGPGTAAHFFTPEPASATEPAKLDGGITLDSSVVDDGASD